MPSGCVNLGVILGHPVAVPKTFDPQKTLQSHTTNALLRSSDCIYIHILQKLYLLNVVKIKIKSLDEITTLTNLKWHLR